MGNSMDLHITYEQMDFINPLSVLKEKSYSTKRENSSKRKPISIPFLKWPGGKRWLVEKYIEYFPKILTGKYIEPFLGGGSVFFALAPKNAILSDISSDLIKTYLGIRDDSKKVFKLLSEHSQHHDTEYYYHIRSSEPKTIPECAARFIYLNRTCFNGIYRVNKNGKFNVPIGSRTKVLSDTEDFLIWPRILQNILIETSDFERIIDMSEKNDFIFVDPPYTVRHNNNGFIKYNEILFSWEDQLRLHECLLHAKSRGVHILMSNANHQSVKDLYKKGFKQSVISRYSSIAASSSMRNHYEELIVQS